MWDVLMELPDLYVFWTGSNPIPAARKEALLSMSNSGLSLRLISSENLNDYIHPSNIHPAYKYLNLAHRADYLRCYFMHHFGGAYSDLKAISHSWVPAIETMNSCPSCLALGYTEISRHAVANLYQNSVQLKNPIWRQRYDYIRWRWLQINYRRVIGNGAFVFKPNTELTNRWWSDLNCRLDFLLKYLEDCPATEPKERRGHIYDGRVSNYPVPWSYILGDILQPLILKYSSRVIKDLPLPNFKNYQ